MYVLKSPAWALLWPSRITHPYQLLDWVLNPVSNLKSFNQKKCNSQSYIYIYKYVNKYEYIYIFYVQHICLPSLLLCERGPLSSLQDGPIQIARMYTCQLYTNDTSSFSFSHYQNVLQNVLQANNEIQIHMTLCEVLWWKLSRSVTKNLTAYRFNSGRWGLDDMKREIHSFPTMYIMGGGKWCRNG